MRINPCLSIDLLIGNLSFASGKETTANKISSDKRYEHSNSGTFIINLNLNFKNIH